MLHTCLWWHPCLSKERVEVGREGRGGRDVASLLLLDLVQGVILGEAWGKCMFTD